MAERCIFKNFKGLVLLPFLLFPLILFAQKTEIKFTEVSKESGIDFRYNFGDKTYQNILESSGSGVTVFDYDGDHDLDLYMLNGTYLEGISDSTGLKYKNTPNRLYRNNGDGTFTDVTKQAGVGDTHWSMEAGAVDYDNDGDVDLYLLNYGPNVFYRNNGDGTFTDITQSLKLQGPEKLNGFIKWSVSAGFWDYNQDGRTDIMVGNFLAFDPKHISPTMPDMMPHPSEYKGQASMFYEQQPDGTFKEITRQLGLYYPDSKCMGLTIFDYDEDGDLDIFQGNDHQANFMFENEGDGKFKENAVAAGLAVNSQGVPTGSMHGTPGDVDGDGHIDLLVTDLRYGSLYKNYGHGVFGDIVEKSGVADAFRGKGEWAASLFDFDNDGDLDLFSANGTAEELILQLPLLLKNDGKGNFKDVGASVSQYFTEKRSGRAAAVWDYDNDGDLDIIVSHIDLKGTPALLRNDGGNKNHWLGISLIGKNGLVSAIGAKVIVTSGGKKQTLLNQYATSYLSYNDPRVHVGLGKERFVDQLQIFWPDGTAENFDHIRADKYITIVQKKGIVD